MINKSPIYQQLNSYLKNLINSGEYKGGEKFLTERAICDKFGISRATANKALSSLVSEGILEFKKGVGTFVRNRSVSRLIDFRKCAEEAGKRFEETTLTIKRISGEPGWDGDIYRKETLKKADNRAYVLLVQSFSANLLGQEGKEPAGEDLDSLFLSISGNYRRSPATCLRCRNLTESEALLLECDPFESAFAIETDFSLPGEKTLWRESYLFKPGSLEFHYSPESDSPRQSIEYKIMFS